jgi:hypothetical protein
MARMGLLTLAQAETNCGLPPNRGRTLLELLAGKERKLGREIMIRKGRGQRNRHLRVTMSMVRQHCPELFPSAVDDLQRSFSRYMHDIDERISDGVAEHVAAHVDPKLDELWERDEKIARNVKALGQRVEQLSRVAVFRTIPANADDAGGTRNTSRAVTANGSRRNEDTGSG